MTNPTRSIGMLYDILTGPFYGVCTCYMRRTTLLYKFSLSKAIQYFDCKSTKIIS